MFKSQNRWLKKELPKAFLELRISMKPKNLKLTYSFQEQGSETHQRTSKSEDLIIVQHKKYRSHEKNYLREKHMVWTPQQRISSFPPPPPPTMFSLCQQDCNKVFLHDISSWNRNEKGFSINMKNSTP